MKPWDRWYHQQTIKAQRHAYWAFKEIDARKRESLANSPAAAVETVDGFKAMAGLK